MHRLATEFAFEIEKRETSITQLRNEITNLENILDAERKTAAHGRAHLAKAQSELEALKLDDTTAAKMVSRYMCVLHTCIASTDSSFTQEILAVSN